MDTGQHAIQWLPIDESDKAMPRSTFANASIIKSHDSGRTWIRSERENFDQPMFPGREFSTPFFVDYSSSGRRPDGSDRYVYAASNNGFLENGDSVTLGRVRRDRITRLGAGDWEFFQGGDGLIDSAWKANRGAARPIIETPLKIGESGMAYLPQRRRYLMITWYFPKSIKEEGATGHSVWDFWEAPKPWGPWNRIGSHTWDPEGYYIPLVCPVFQKDNLIYVTTCGDWSKWWEGYQRLTFVPLTLG